MAKNEVSLHDSESILAGQPLVNGLLANMMHSASGRVVGHSERMPNTPDSQREYVSVLVKLSTKPGASSKDFKLLLMHVRITLDDEFFAGRGLDLRNQCPVMGFERRRHLRMKPQMNDIAINLRGHLPRL